MTMFTLKVRIDAGNAIVIVGRAAWALLELLTAGNIGCTYIDNPAPRWSGYIHKLRKLGATIDTLQEAHGGPFAGFHARYVLRSSVTVLKATVGAADAHSSPTERHRRGFDSAGTSGTPELANNHARHSEAGGA
ncbi:winged helix domain-containing protein [Bradyrhizobium diazoefficiens]